MTRKRIRGSLHSHECHTDHRNEEEWKKFPFDLEAFVRLCLEIGRDFQAISEIKDHPTEAPRWWNEKRYSDLMKTAKSSPNYEAHISPNICEVYLKPEDKKIVIIKGQEVCIGPLKHVSAIGVTRDLQGGLDTRETLKIIREEGGYAFANHPFTNNEWTEEELLSFYEQGLLQAAEFNSKLTFPNWLDFGFRLIGKRTPSRGNNKRVLKLESRMPIIANDDANSEDDIRKGAYTCYDIIPGQDLIKSIFDAIKQRTFLRIEKYSSFLSPVKHLLEIRQSAKLPYKTN